MAKGLAGFLNEKLDKEVYWTYYAEMSLEERRATYKRWKDEDIVCIVATSALRAGIDQSGVRLVIHHGHRRSLIDQCQEIRKGGRDRNPAECCTIFWQGIIAETSWIPEMEKAPVIVWIDSMSCRRFRL